jgi:PAS domain S-box-containing protein
MDKMHSLLKRQLKKIFGSADSVPKYLQEFVGAVNEAYINFDDDRLLLERSIDISSRELMEANSQMRSVFQALPDMFLRIDADGKILECKIPANKTFSHINPNEILGKSIYASFGPIAARRLEWVVRRAVKNKNAEIAEYSVHNQTEQFREARVVWLGNDQLVVIVRDITERKMAEDQLLENRRTLQTLMSNLPGMAYRCRNDRDRTMEFVSEGCANLTGYQPSELINNNKTAYNQLIHPDECDKVSDAIQAALKEHKPFQITYRIKTTEGEQKWVWEQGQGVFGPKGELIAVEGFVSDTTGKMQIQESIKESEHFLSEIFSCIQDGISVLDTNLNIIQTNKAAEKWYAHAMPLVGKKCYEAYHSRKTRCDVCPTCRTIETGKADYDAHSKNGPGGKITGWIDLYSFPLIDEATGKLKGVIEYARDVTETKLASESLQESEEKYRAVIETTDMGFVSVDEQGEVLNANLNYACMVGYSSVDEIIGHNIIEWTASYDLERNRTEIRKCSEKVPVKNLEIDYKRIDGTIIPVEINATIVKTKNEKMIFTLCRDITERKRTQKSLKDSEEYFRTLFKAITDAVFVHEFREDGTVSNFLEVNDVACKRLGYTRDELLKMSLFDIDAPESNVDIKPFVNRIKKGESVIFEQIHVAKDGRRIPVEIHSQLFKLGSQTAILFLVRDISERKAAENQMPAAIAAISANDI